MKIFYSWQSDLPNKTNRGLIGKALEEAVSRIRNDGSLQVEPVVDRDTAGVAGAPDIGGTIFEKIGDADMFVCDVSIVHRWDKPTARTTPNPNVLVELGYAAHALGWDRILMVMNDAYGQVGDLPFDLKMKRTILYTSEAEANDRATARHGLAEKLEYHLRMVIERFEKTPEAVGDSDEARQKAAAHDRDVFGQLEKLCSEDFLMSALEMVGSDHSYSTAEVDPLEQLLKELGTARSRFLSDRLDSTATALRESIRELSVFLSQHFFGRSSLATGRYFLYPDLNVDREGTGEASELQRYAKHASNLENVLSRVEGAYRTYRRAVKETLFV